MELVCYTAPGWAPRIRPASQKREWMDATPEAYAYRCLPLNIANTQGWEVLSPCTFSAIWDGGLEASSLQIDESEAGDANFVPVSLFGSGIITFHIEGLIRTPPGWNLWVSGPPNLAKDGIAPLGGIVETDWSPYTFTMNWKLTRPGHRIRFEENEPFCFFFPVPRTSVEEFEPRFAPMSEAPELQREFEQWSVSRLEFHQQMQRSLPDNPSDRWQKLYYRGVCPSGKPGADDHCAKVRVRPFAGPGPLIPDEENRE